MIKTTIISSKKVFCPITRFLALLSISLLLSSCAVQQGQPIQAFLPMADSVPRSESMDIDGVWRISTIGKDIRIEGGRAYAIDGWMHLFTLQIQPNMVVLKDIKPDGMGGYSGYDLPLMGKWQARRADDGALNVSVAGAVGPAAYRLLPIKLDDEGGVPDYGDDGDVEDDGLEYIEPRPVPPPGFVPPTPIHAVGNTLVDIGKNCYKDFKPMGGAMLKYQTCQMGLGNFNALKKALTAQNVDDAKAVLFAKACRNEFNNLVDTVRRKGFQSVSIGVSGEVAALIGGSGEAFMAINLDLSKPTIYGSLGAGLGTQAGGSLNGVVSAFYGRSDRLSGKGKSFSVSLKALGGAGGAVGLSSGSAPKCESFSAMAGAGAEVNAGTISATRTFKLVRIPKPDFSPACTDVSVTATNQTGKEIKIVDIDFYDYKNKRWRSKIIKNEKVPNGRTWRKTLRLQKVGGDKTRVRVQYRVKNKGNIFNPWSKIINRVTGIKTCGNGMAFSTNLTKR